jgi:hypothetical protein
VGESPKGQDVIWDVTNQDADSNADGGWNSSFFPVDKTKKYRFSVWIKKPVTGYVGGSDSTSGYTYLGVNGFNSSGSNIGVRYTGSTGTTTNPYFYATRWGSLVGTSEANFWGGYGDLFGGEGDFSNGTGMSQESGSNATNTVITKLNPGHSQYVLEQSMGVASTEYQLNLSNLLPSKTYVMSGWYAESSDYNASERMFHARTYSSSGAHIATGSGIGTVLETKVVDGVTWRFVYQTINSPADASGSFNWYVGYAGDTYSGKRYYTDLRIEEGTFPKRANWYLLVGHVHPYTSAVGISTDPETGVYNHAGEKILGGTDYVWVDGTTQSRHRSYLYYATNTATRQQFWEPRVDDTTHSSFPTVAEMIANSGSYTRQFAGNYTGNYSRTFVGNYSRAFAGEYTRTRVTDYVGDYIGNFARGFVGDYARGFAGDYIGNYARGFVGEYTRNSTRTRVSSYAGEFTGNYTRTFVGNYTRTSLRTRVSNYAGNFTGDYTRGFLGEYTRTSTRVRNSNFLGNFIGNYTRDFAGEYTRVSTRTRVSSYVGNYTRGFLGEYTRTSLRTRVSAFIGDFTGNYSREFAGEYTRISTRTRVSSYLGNYSRTFVGNYSRNSTRVSTRTRLSIYSRTRVSAYSDNYTRNRETDFVGDFIGNYARGFVGNYSRDFAGDYTRNFAGEYVGDFTGNYTRTFAGNYARDFVGNYSRDFVGNYVGTTLNSGTEVIDTYTLYVRVA